MKPGPGPQLAEKIDELGALEREFAPLQPKLARIELLRKEIRAAFAHHASEESFRPEGARFVCLLGPKGMQRAVDAAQLLKHIGVRTFSRMASIGVGVLDDFVKRGDIPAEIAYSAVKEGRTGPRPIKIFERGTAVP